MTKVKTKTYRGRVVNFGETVPNKPMGMVFDFALLREPLPPPSIKPEDPQPVVYIRFADENAADSAGLAFVACGFKWLVEVDVIDDESGVVLAVRRVD